MTTDLKSMTVEELRELVVDGWDTEIHLGWPLDVEAFDELARRLEEAQQKIVAQQEELKEAKQQNLELLEQQVRMLNWRDRNYEEQFAHDAEVAAKAKAEALEERADVYGENQPPYSIHAWITRDLLAKAAEYRDKAVRKE